MSWKSLAAAALVAGLCAGPSARAGDLFRVALPAGRTVPVGWQNYNHGVYRYPYRCWPPYSVGIGVELPPEFFYAPPIDAPPAYAYGPPPVSVYVTPPYPAPNSLRVETYSSPGGAATYSVTRPVAGPGAEQVRPPAPRDGAPADPVPMPKAAPAGSPRHFRLAPLDELRASLPARPKDAGRGR